MSRRWKILTILGVAVVALTCLWIGTLGIGPEKEVEAYKKSLIARGEKLEISELVPPPVPDGQNGADIVKAASTLLISTDDDWTNMPPTMRMVAPGKAMVCSAQPGVRERYFTNSWSNVTAMVEANRPGTELLRQLTNFPDIDFHINYDLDLNNFAVLWDWAETNMILLRKCGDKLSADAMCNLRGGDAAPAAIDIQVMLALINGEQDDRFFYSQYARMEMALSTAAETWELLQSTNINDEELAVLQKSWERLEFIHAFESAFLMDRAMIGSVIQKMRDSDAYFKKMIDINDDWDFSGDWDDKWDTVKELAEGSYAISMWRASWTYSDELQMLQDDQLILETIRTIEKSGSFNPAYTKTTTELNNIEESHAGGDPANLRWMFSERSESVGYELLKNAMSSEAATKIVVTAIALKRYQLKHRAYPADLNSLVPEFLSAIPLDPVDGNPLRYHPNADGTFLLYSIGVNGKDDGGVSADRSLYYKWLDIKAPDWVWPQPATPAEIQAFYAHPPK